MWTHHEVHTAWTISGEAEFGDFLSRMIPPSEDYSWYRIYLLAAKEISNRNGYGVTSLLNQCKALAYVLTMKEEGRDPDDCLSDMQGEQATAIFLSRTKRLLDLHFGKEQGPEAPSEAGRDVLVRGSERE